MRTPLRLTFRNVDSSPALESRIRELAARLERFSDQIERCHVVLEAPHRHLHQWGLFEVRIDVSVPEGEIAIRHTHPLSHSHEDPYVALRDAFRAARRKLQDYERKRYKNVRTN
jgi:ribosome-associated translation inhibitor RaiA